ncbi:SpoIIE family protein phosphatase [Streptomyces sp. DSM 41524]|uniref:SpoIIE family protein phosphatase n=1 Tax=Streptomyces asiaticus subsp. ignotus TaxID=3098222 RepID=A0ABU7QAL6_9ACTN|nr:SpoIIE family protein phosphatase [Streptomyces sp. DSM 41524]
MNAFSDHERGEAFPFGDVAAALVDGNGIVRGWSRTAARLLDRSPADVCGHSLRRLLVQQSDPTCGPGSAGQALLRHRSGRAVDVAFDVLPLDGTSDLLVLAAPTLRVTGWGRNEAVVRALLAQDRVGLGIHDMDLMTLHSNVTPDMFGGNLVVDSQLREIISDPDAAAALRRVLVTGIPMIDRKQRVRTPRVPGKEWCLSLSAFRLEDAKGQPTGLATLFTDITEQQRSSYHLDLRHEAATRVGRSLDVLRTAQDLVDVLVPALGDLAWVSLAEAVLEGDEPPKLAGPGQWHLRRAAAASVGPWPPGLWPPELGDEPPMPDVPVLRRVQHGETVVAPDRAAFMAMIDFDSQLAAFLIPEHGHSLVAAPLFARGLVLGAVVVWRTSRPEPFDQADAELLTEIATRGALSVDNARRYTREHREAVVLQQRLLPRAATDTPAAETTGFYRPAGNGADISGDWFEAIPLPSLRVALIIGDVTGHGLPATATMGRLRAAIHTLADLEMEPDELLTHVDDLVQQLGNEAPQGQQDTVGATCLYVVYDPVTGRCTMASAGHPPPIVVRPDGTVRDIDVTPGPPLGVGGMPFEVAETHVAPGSILALYTDGLVEHGDHDLAAGIQQLTDDLAAFGGPGQTLDDIGRSLLTGTSDAPARDDIALLLARTRAIPSDNVASWEFAADLTQVASAREATTRQLSAWGLDVEDVAFTTELLVSELVTNAIRYAGGPVGLRLIREDVLVCEISDPSNTQPRLRRARTTDEGGRGLFLVAQLASRWGCRYGHTGKTIWTEQPLAAAGARPER